MERLGHVGVGEVERLRGSLGQEGWKRRPVCVVLLLYYLGSGEDFVACVMPQGKVKDILAAHGAVGVWNKLIMADKELQMDKNVQERVHPACCR